jgi:predicted GNAT family N-acyltransferase
MGGSSGECVIIIGHLFGFGDRALAAFRVRRAQWQRDQPALRKVREAVFVVEQQVPLELEWDELDAVSQHVLAETAAGEPIGTGRLLPDGHVGRMAVLSEWRGRQVGSRLLQHLIEAAREAGMPEIVLHAQSHAVGFYARHGFAPEGGPFLEAGIPHQLMRLRF